MALVDEAKKVSRQRGTTCGAGKFLATLSTEEQGEVAECLADPSVSDRATRDALVARGHECVPQVNVWGHHRRGECRCEPS